MSRNNRNVVCTLLAVTAPLAHYAGIGYMAVLLAGGAMLPLTVLAGDGRKRVSKPEAALELLWLGVVLGSILPVSGANWPGSRAEMVVPLTILLLSAMSGNREKRERACAALYWAALIPMLLVAGAVIGKAEPKWLVPAQEKWNGGLIAALLFPALIGGNGKGNLKTALVTGGVAGALSVIIQGTIGILPVASPLYEVGRCVGNGGFEIIVSVLLTISWYGFVSMGMGASEEFGTRLGLTEHQSHILVLILAGILVLGEVQISNEILIAGCLILWILIPVLHPEK